jgi:hypothetical protein
MHSYSLSNNARALGLYNHDKRELLVHHDLFIDFDKFKAELYGPFNLLDVDELVILDIINTFNKMNLAITNRRTEEDWYWDREELVNSRGLMSNSIVLKIYQLFYVVAALFLISFASSLYSKLVTFMSPLILYTCATLGNYSNKR